jgi:cyclopropane fatty-acyl-phospholipid synthase-like methyltransferase
MNYKNKADSNMDKVEKDQKERGLHAILSYPLAYKYFQRFSGVEAAFRKYVNYIIKPDTNARILDIGCGEGYILNFLPLGVTYVGYDMSPAYIDYARKKFKNRGKFINERVSEMALKDNEPFDIVLATGLLHHLNDTEGQELFKIGYNCLKSDGLMFTYDNAYYNGQSAIARYISSKDRGQHVRFPEQYHKIASSAFEDIEVMVRNDMIWVPQTVCILKCRKTNS